jgi:hypothetical protein
MHGVQQKRKIPPRDSRCRHDVWFHGKGKGAKISCPGQHRFYSRSSIDVFVAAVRENDESETLFFSVLLCSETADVFDCQTDLTIGFSLSLQLMPYFFLLSTHQMLLRELFRALIEIVLIGSRLFFLSAVDDAVI